MRIVQLSVFIASIASVGSIALGASVGCVRSGAPPGQSPGEARMLLHTQRGLRDARIDGDRFFGPDIEVERYADGYRGRVGPRVVDVRLDGTVIRGTVGSGHTELHVESQPGALIIRGLYGGRLGELDIKDGRLVGRLGSCEYDLRGSNAEPAPGELVTFVGSRACEGDGHIGRASVTLPTAFASKPSIDRGALIAFLLGE